MNEHDEDELLRRILTGDSAPDDPDSARSLQDNPRLRARLDQLSGLQDRLDAVGTGDRRALSEAAGDRSPLEERLPEMIGRARQHGGPDRARIWPRLLVAAAAAVLLVGTWLAWPSAAEPPDAPLYMGVAPGSMQPDGPTPDFAVFEWNFELPAGASFEVRVFAADDAMMRTVLASANTGAKMVWKPTPATRAELPDHIQWQVIVVPNSGPPRGAGIRRAQRSP